MNEQNAMIRFSLAHHHEKRCPVSNLIIGHFEVFVSSCEE